MPGGMERLNHEIERNNSFPGSQISVLLLAVLPDYACQHASMSLKPSW
jgi:hypothetical protein